MTTRIISRRLAAGLSLLALAAAAAPVSPAEGLRALARSARADPALAAWFDGGASAGYLGLNGLTFRRDRWLDGRQELARLGRGDFGFVDEHPRLPGAVIKTVSVVNLFANPHPTQVAALEEKTSRALASADSGPRYLGRASIEDQEVSVRERVYGETFENLAAEGRFGPAERELVVDLLRRLAAAGLTSDDMKPSNIMLGTTALDGRRRAYLVDGGNLAQLPPGSVEERVGQLLSTQVLLNARFQEGVGLVVHTRPLTEFLDAGVRLYGRTTAWLRFKGFWTDLLGRR